MGSLYLWLYQLLFTLALPLVVIRFGWRGRKAPAYRERFLERLGYVPMAQADIRPKLWFHAVSLGEMIAATPLIKQLLIQFPEYQWVITTTTPTGSQRVKANFGSQVLHCYVPLDVPLAYNRFLNLLSPQLCIVMETELWPTLIHSVSSRNIPIMLVNARLSEKSMNGYRRIAPLMRFLLPKLRCVYAQSEADRQRFIALGCPDNNVITSGNLKFDIQPKAEAKTVAAALKTAWGADRLVWIAASTHETEEAFALQAHAKVLEQFPTALLIIVPRHPERFNHVAALITSQGYQLIRRSEKTIPNAQTQVFLGDTLGELDYFYAAAEVAFVGGSFVSLGGHNLLEPAALSLAITTGPTLHNFAEITRLLSEAQAVQVLNHPDHLAEAVMALFANPEKRHAMGKAALAVVKQNQGALKKTLQGICEVVEK